MEQSTIKVQEKIYRAAAIHIQNADRTQEELAEEAGLSKSTISAIATGTRQLTAETVPGVSAALRMHYSNLVEKLTRDEVSEIELKMPAALAHAEKVRAARAEREARAGSQSLSRAEADARSAEALRKKSRK